MSEARMHNMATGQLPQRSIIATPIVKDISNNELLQVTAPRAGRSWAGARHSLSRRW